MADNCSCRYPTVSYLRVDFCAACDGSLAKRQHEVLFEWINTAVPQLRGCRACGTVVMGGPRQMELHISMHKDQRLWMESLMIRLGEMHGYLMKQEIDKAISRCQDIIDSFPTLKH